MGGTSSKTVDAAHDRKSGTKDSLNLLLIGKTGHGKSSLGNAILGRKNFKTSAGVHSATKEVQDAWTDDESIHVVDGPGLSDTDLTLAETIVVEQACTNMGKALSMCNGGVHAFLFVIPFGIRLTDEEKKAFSDLETIFGANYLKEHGMIVMTHGDNFAHSMMNEKTPNKSFQEWCQEQDLFKICPRIILFSNLTTDELEQNNQRNELLQLADELRQEKGLYTSKYFKMYRDLRKEMQKDLPLLKESIQRKTNLLAAEIKGISKKSTLKVLEHLQTRINIFHKKILHTLQKEKYLKQKIDNFEKIKNASENPEIAIKEKKTVDIESLQQLLTILEKMQNITQDLEISIKQKNTENTALLVGELKLQRKILLRTRKSAWEKMFNAIGKFKDKVFEIFRGCCIFNVVAKKYEQQAEKNDELTKTNDVQAKTKVEPIKTNDVPAMKKVEPTETYHAPIKKIYGTTKRNNATVKLNKEQLEVVLQDLQQMMDHVKEKLQQLN